MTYTYTVTDGVETFTWDVQGEIIISRRRDRCCHADDHAERWTVAAADPSAGGATSTPRVVVQREAPGLVSPGPTGAHYTEVLRHWRDRPTPDPRRH
jgi:hypothetical protein